MDNMAVPHRKKVRLKEYDYSTAGAYFVTICTKNRVNYLSSIQNDETILTGVGKMIEDYLFELELCYECVKIDYYVIMPNHVHFICCIEDDGFVSLNKLIQEFKSKTTVHYIKKVKDSGWTPLDKQLWQRGYYEHVIRNDNDMFIHRNYIIENPIKWDLDEYNQQSRKGAKG